MIPIDCKIAKFSSHLFLCLFKDYHNYLARAQPLISGKPVRQYTHIHSFSAHYTAPQGENSMKSIYIINPAIMENMECSIVKVHTSFNSGFVTLSRCITTPSFCF